MERSIGRTDHDVVANCAIATGMLPNDLLTWWPSRMRVDTA